MLPKRVKIVEVGPRDGLQNESKILSLDTKIELVERLSNTGLTVIEIGSFVSPVWVPQMAQTAQVATRIHRLPHVQYPALVPNQQGLEAAAEAGITEIAIFTACSDTFCEKNINMNILESLTCFARLIKQARDNYHMKVRGYLSCCLGCPYEGVMDTPSVANLAGALFEMGCYEISLADTTGVGTPLAAIEMVDAVKTRVPTQRIAIHFHDTFGQGLANIFAVMNKHGISVIDTSINGLGGCPYALGAKGNVATEDLVFMLNGMSVETGVELDELVKTATWLNEKLGRNQHSNVTQALQAKS